MHKPPNLDKGPRFAQLAIASAWALYGYQRAIEMTARNIHVSGRP